MGTFLKICGCIFLGLMAIVAAIFVFMVVLYVHDHILIFIANRVAKREGRSNED